MGWVLMTIPGVGTIATIAGWATKVVNNFRYLKGLDGTVALDDGLNLGANELTINSLETVGVDGIVNKEQVEDHTHVDTANCGTLDHGLALTGLTDDDHTQYQKENLLTTAGDMPYATAASTWARLPKGTALQFLKMNSDASAPAWATAGPTTSALITVSKNTGDASGNNSYTGAGFQPKALVAVGGNNIGSGACDVALIENGVWLSTDLLTSKTGFIVLGGVNIDTNNQVATVVSLDADGFTLSWVKEGNPSGTVSMYVLCLG